MLKLGGENNVRIIQMMTKVYEKFGADIIKGIDNANAGNL